MISGSQKPAEELWTECGTRGRLRVAHAVHSHSWRKKFYRKRAVSVSGLGHISPLPKWITTQEAAELSGFHPEYVRRLARQGKIGVEKRGRDWWIDREVLQAYLQTIETLGSQKFDPRGP